MALPHDTNLPLISPQSSDVPKVAASVRRQFGNPELPLRFRESRKRATRMTVPEATVNEDNLPVLGENKVGLSRKTGNVESESVSARMDDFPHQEFWFCILAADERHPLAALEPSKRIHWPCKSS